MANRQTTEVPMLSWLAQEMDSRHARLSPLCDGETAHSQPIIVRVDD